MEYSEKPPESIELSQYIDSIWHCKNDNDTSKIISVVPDTCADIIFRYLPSNTPELFVSGEMTKAVIVPVLPNEKYLGIRFKPGYLSSLITIPMSELTDLNITLKEVCPDLYNTLKPAIKPNQSEYHIQSILRKLIQKCDGIDPIVHCAINLISQSNGMITVEKLSKEIGISTRHVQRVFLKTVGLPPKLFARIVRFNKTKANGNFKETYYDQSHFLREYKEFTSARNL